jgi:hypothetical protein
MNKSIMINNVINNKQVRTNKNVQRKYTFDKKNSNYHLEINIYLNPDKQN